MKYFVPDSVANEVHERDIPDQIVAGLPLAQAVNIIDAYDSYNIDGDSCFEVSNDHRDYREGNDVGTLAVNTDRSHYYGIVFSPSDPGLAKERAEELLNSW